MYLGLSNLGLVGVRRGASAPPFSPADVAALTHWSDPSNFGSMEQSSVSGGAVTATGQLVGKSNAIAPATVTLSVPDVNRHMLQADGGGKYFLNTGQWWTASGGGGSTTGFFFIQAFKVREGWTGTMWSDHTSANPNAGYEIIFDADADRMKFSIGTGAGRTVLTDGTAIGYTAGGPRVVMCWDDGVNWNIQVNNNAVVSAARAAVSAGNATPTINQQDVANTAPFYSNFYGMMWAKDNGLTAGQRANLKTWLGAKAGLAL